MAANSGRGATSETLCESAKEDSVEEETTLKLKLQSKKKPKKKIQWTEDTVDNEGKRIFLIQLCSNSLILGLGKKKSKCCCQYTKPRKDLDCSSSEEEEDCDHCPGH